MTNGVPDAKLCERVLQLSFSFARSFSLPASSSIECSPRAAEAEIDRRRSRKTSGQISTRSYEICRQHAMVAGVSPLRPSRAEVLKR
jgi:hypothetical protein